MSAFVELYFLQRRFERIDAEAGRDQTQVDHDIADFLPNMSTGCFIGQRTLLGSHPLENFNQFGAFDG